MQAFRKTGTLASVLLCNHQHNDCVSLHKVPFRLMFTVCRSSQFVPASPILQFHHRQHCLCFLFAVRYKIKECYHQLQNTFANIENSCHCFGLASIPRSKKKPDSYSKTIFNPLSLSVFWEIAFSFMTILFKSALLLNHTAQAFSLKTEERWFVCPWTLKTCFLFHVILQRKWF